jgi:hypothetical protein
MAMRCFSSIVKLVRVGVCVALSFIALDSLVASAADSDWQNTALINMPTGTKLLVNKAIVASSTAYDDVGVTMVYSFSISEQIVDSNGNNSGFGPKVAVQSKQQIAFSSIPRAGNRDLEIQFDAGVYCLGFKSSSAKMIRLVFNTCDGSEEGIFALYYVKPVLQLYDDSQTVADFEKVVGKNLILQKP